MPRNESIRMITNDSNWHSQRYYFSISRRISAKQLPPHSSSEKKESPSYINQKRYYTKMPL